MREIVGKSVRYVDYVFEKRKWSIDHGRYLRTEEQFEKEKVRVRYTVVVVHDRDSRRNRIWLILVLYRINFRCWVARLKTAGCCLSVQWAVLLPSRFLLLSPALSPYLFYLFLLSWHHFYALAIGAVAYPRVAIESDSIRQHRDSTWTNEYRFCARYFNEKENIGPENQFFFWNKYSSAGHRGYASEHCHFICHHKR